MTIDYKSAGYTAFPFMAVNPLDSEQSIEVLNEKVRPGEVIGHEGMTLRDYFAAAALQGLLQRPDTDNYNRYDFAAEAYRQADAMLEARQVQL